MLCKLRIQELAQFKQEAFFGIMFFVKNLIQDLILTAMRRLNNSA